MITNAGVPVGQLTLLNSSGIVLVRTMPGVNRLFSTELALMGSRFCCGIPTVMCSSALDLRKYFEMIAGDVPAQFGDDRFHDTPGAGVDDYLKQQGIKWRRVRKP